MEPPTPPAARTQLPVTQYTGRPGVLDLGWGHPPAWALPTGDWIGATETALTRSGWKALTYGYARGPGPLVDWLASRLGGIDGRSPRPEEMFVTAGASQALDLICAVLTRPGDVVLVDSPTYHLALRIVADHDVELVGAPADADGIDPAGTARLLARLQAAGRRVPLLYLVPTFANPTGGCLPDDRRSALVEVALRTGTVIVEDDCYRELAYESPPPASLWSRSDGAAVLRIGSFSKTVAPGLRLGFLTGSPAFVEGLAQRGLVDSGGGVNHTTALAMAAFGDSGGYDRHLARVLAGYRAQRDALTGALQDRLAAVPVQPPGGGWFVWLRLPDWAPARRLLDHAERYGVSFLPGYRCHAHSTANSGGDSAGDGAGGQYIRLSFSLFEPALLVEAVGRLGQALDDLAAAAHPGSSPPDA